MLSPAPKLLWEARDRDERQSYYNRWLVDWEGKEYLHGEITDIKPPISLYKRTEKWLEETGDLGMILIALGRISRRPECCASANENRPRICNRYGELMR
jgi:hypothetical protein